MNAIPLGSKPGAGGKIIKRLSHRRFQWPPAAAQPSGPEAYTTTPAAAPTATPAMPPPAGPPVPLPAMPPLGGKTTMNGGDQHPHTVMQELCDRIREMWQLANDEHPPEFESGAAGRPSMPAAPPDPDSLAHILWYKDNRNRLPKESFQLSAGKYITSTEQFYRALDDEIAAYPNGIRAHVIGQDLLQLRGHVEGRIPSRP